MAQFCPLRDSRRYPDIISENATSRSARWRLLAPAPPVAHPAPARRVKSMSDFARPQSCVGIRFCRRDVFCEGALDVRAPSPPPNQTIRSGFASRIPARRPSTPPLPLPRRPTLPVRPFHSAPSAPMSSTNRERDYGIRNLRNVGYKRGISDDGSLKQIAKNRKHKCVSTIGVFRIFVISAALGLYTP